MRYEAEIKELLIENAIHLIAEGGFEKATTKELTHCGGHLPDFKMNEAYIYRFSHAYGTMAIPASGNTASPIHAISQA